MTETYRGLAVQVDDESLGDVPFGTFEPLFRAELERTFPGVSVEIDHGTGARVEYSGIEPNDETVHECSEVAFKQAIDHLNAGRA
jgi:hypothetical protein